MIRIGYWVHGFTASDAPPTPRRNGARVSLDELQWSDKQEAIGSTRLVLLACGGDGTFNWLLNLMRQVDPEAMELCMLIPIPFGASLLSPVIICQLFLLHL